MNILIRDARIDDEAVIVEFNQRLAVETEDKQLDHALIDPGVAAVLRDATLGRYWLATVSGGIAGQIMVTYEWSDWRNGMLWWIGSVYVEEQFRRQGIFRALYRYVESLAKANQNACGLRLYVEKDNLRAQQTYHDLDMHEPGYLVMESIF